MSKGISSEQDDFFVASHEVLFEEAGPVHCDACGRPLTVDGTPSDLPELDQRRGEARGGYRIPGTGVYLWARANGVR